MVRAPYRDTVFVRAPALPAARHADLAAELEPGETLLWAAAAVKRRLARRALGAFGFPVAWNTFLIGLVALGRHDSAMWLGSVPLLAMGIPLFAGPLAALRAATSTFYAVTDRRLLAFEHDHVTAFARDGLRVDVLERRADGSADLRAVTRRESVVLAGVADAERVAAMLGAC